MQSHPAAFVPAGSNRSGCGGDEATEAFDVEGHVGDLASTQTAAEGNAVQASKRLMWKPTRPLGLVYRDRHHQESHGTAIEELFAVQYSELTNVCVHIEDEVIA
jgi:hypothetical protein